MKKVLSLLGRYYFVIVFLALLILPRYSKDYVLVLVSDILLYITLTMSWVLFSGPTRYISLAPAAFFGIGVYVVALLGMSMALPWIIAIAACASFVIAFLIGAITLRLRGIYFTMATFGLMELIRHLILWWEVNISGTVGRVVIPLKYTTVYYGMLVIATCVLLTVFFLGRSRLGLALRSIGDSEEAAAHTGINVTMIKTVIFALSTVFMGVSGVLMATRWTYIDPRIAFNALYSFMPVLMAIFGGMEKMYGPVLGAVIFTLLDEILVAKLPYHHMLIFGLVLVISILYMPHGIVGLIRGWVKGGER